MTTAATAPVPRFEYPASLQEYMVSEKDYLKQHPEYHALCTGIAVFNQEGKLLLVQRSASEKAFPNAWVSLEFTEQLYSAPADSLKEIPGGKVDDTDETVLHGAVRELKEETGLEATRIVRKVGEFWFGDTKKADGQVSKWVKHIFEMEVKDLATVTVDPVEHQTYLFASEEEVKKERVGDVELKYITAENKAIKLDAFAYRQSA
jgi:8-oxo-dGTP pyrophosphatase MutT (NUDIX family)